jgi:hypothetical protein
MLIEAEEKFLMASEDHAVCPTCDKRFRTDEAFERHLFKNASGVGTGCRVRLGRSCGLVQRGRGSNRAWEAV